MAATSFDKELLDTGGRLSANPSYRSNVSRKELDQDLIPIRKIQNSVSSTTMSTSGESRGKQSELVKKQNLEKGFQFNIAVISILRRPLRRKLRKRWFFDVSEVKESSFFLNRTSLTPVPQIFDAQVLENAN